MEKGDQLFILKAKAWRQKSIGSLWMPSSSMANLEKDVSGSDELEI